MVWVSLFAAGLVAVQSQGLERTDLEAWREHIRPTMSELAYAELDWHRDLASGLRAAADSERPLLLWVMNGHPLGCT